MYLGGRGGESCRADRCRPLACANVRRAFAFKERPRAMARTNRKHRGKFALAAPRVEVVLVPEEQPTSADQSRLPRGHSSMPTWSCTCRTASRPRPSGSTVARSIRKARSTSSWRPTRRSPRNTPRHISSAAKHHRPCMTPRSKRTSGSRLGQPPGRPLSFPAAIEGAPK